jgi:hypoxia up-regulated 1
MTFRRRNMPISAYSPLLTFVLFPFLLFLLCLPAPASAAGSAVLGIDLGTEYLKAALVKPGIPLEIVLTKDSKRKEYAAVAFKPSRDGNAAFPERFYGSDALALAARYPDDVYSNLKTLLGLPFSEDSEAVKLYSGRYPALQLEAAEGDRDTVALRSQRLGAAEGKDAFLVEEILSMQLKQIKANAETLAGKGSIIQDAVITYPAYYTAEERRSVELAAELAGLHVEALISDGLAVGLNYATSRTFPSVSDGEQPEYHLVYDMGAGSTTATVLRFQSRAVKDVGRFNKTVQEVHVLGAGWDRTLGGDALNQLIVDDMVNKLVESKKLQAGTTVSDVKAHGKTMAKLWKDSERVRQILSANTETSSTFEGLYEEDVIFKYKTSRSEFEKLAKDQALRVGKPIEDALEAAGLKLSDLESVILHGGVIRTPFVQKQLENKCGSGKLRTNVNADEAAVFGAAFKGAALSPSFRVKDIRAVDSASYAVKIKWTSDEKERQQKLFTPTSQVGVEKQVTVKNLEDFEFSFYQQIPAGEDVIETPVLNVATQNLTASVSKLTEKFACAPVNITTKLNVRLSPIDGLPEVTGASVSCEVEKKGSVVDDVKGFFGLGKKDDQKPLKEETDDEPTESVTLEDEAPTSTAAESSATTTTAASAKETQKTEAGPRIESIAVSLKSSSLGRPPLSTTERQRIEDRLAAFDASDRERVQREEALNELEAFIYRGRDLADDSEFLKAVKEDQLAVLNERIEAASEWLYGDGADANTKDFKEKLASLTEIVNPALKRKKENSERGVKVQLLQEMLNGAKSIQSIVEMQVQSDEETFSSLQAAESESSTETSTTSTPPTTASASDDLEEDPYSSSSSSSTKTSATAKPTAPTYSIYTPQDASSLKSVLDSVNAWLDAQLEIQKTLTESDDPAITVADIDSRLKELERVLQRIYTKMGAKTGGGDSSSKKSEGKKKDSSKSKTKSKSDKTSTKAKPSAKDEL